MTNTALEKTEQPSDVARPEQIRGGTFFTPRVDILETGDELVLFADVPGARTEDLELRFEKGELTVHARCSPRGQDANFLMCEYGVGDFHRVFSISDAIDSSRIAAELKNGVLTVHLPKSEAVKPRRITVK
jgi:HSP20 family molecular chaperone IbpA